VQTTGDHQMQDEPEIAIHSNGDAFADAAKFADDTPFGIGKWRLGGSEEEGARDSNAHKRLANNAGFEYGEVGGDVGEFWHAYQLAGCAWGFATLLFAKGRNNRGPLKWNSAFEASGEESDICDKMSASVAEPIGGV
jgi:hypothetical protein